MPLMPRMPDHGDRTPWLHTRRYRHDVTLITKPADDDVMQCQQARFPANP